MTIHINIPGYRLERQIGKGGMATVYLAVQESFGRHVALKIMSPLRSAADPSFSVRFLREARTVSQMHHGHIVPVYDVGEHEQHQFLSMEFLAGGELRSRVSRNPGLETALAVGIPMAFALGYAHSKGVVHRDVKPENILFREDGTPVLSDFGIARAADVGTALTQTGMLIGTPAYVSPEQAKGLALDGRTDLYSLGIVFYELLTGTQPYRADSTISLILKHLNDAIPKLPPHLAHVQPFLDRALAKEPDERFSTAAEMAQAMQAFLPSGYASGNIVTALPSFGTNGSQPIGPAVTSNEGDVAAMPGFKAANVVPSATTTIRHLRRPAVRHGALAVSATALAAGGLLIFGGDEPTSFTVDTAHVRFEAPDQAQDEINQILTDAEVARLGNDIQQAETLYRRVLASDKANESALRGMESIAEHYRNVGSDALDVMDLSAAQEAILHASDIEPNDPLSKNLLARLQRLQEER